MPEKSNQSQNNQKKGRLGRGLGSLLGGGALDTQEETPSQTPATPAPVAPTGPTASPPAVAAVKAPTTAPAAAAPGPARTAEAPATKAAVSIAPAAAQVNPGPATQAPAAVTPTPAVTPTVAPSPINEESQIWMIPIDRLSPNTQQPRQVFTAEALRDLAASIKEKGVLQPITARRLGEREFQIIAGERRWRAAQAAGLHQVPVILKKVDEQASLELAIIENIQRENLNAMEEAEAFEHLITDYSLTQQQVADKLGKERSSVANTLRLLTLPTELKDLVKNNQLSAGHAKVLLSLDSQRDQIAIAKQVINDKLSVRATEKLVAKAKTDARSAASGQPTKALNVNVSQRLIDGLSAELQKLIGTKVSIDYADSKGKLAIHFYSDDQLTHVVEKLRKAWEK